MNIYKDVLNNCLQGICIIVDRKFIYTNSAFLDLFEYNENELNELTVCDIVHNEDKQIVSNCEEESKKIPSICEYRGVTKSGEVKYLRCYSNPVEWKGQTGSQFLIIDITEDKNKEKEHTLMYATVNENVNIGLWRIDCEGNLIYANTHFCKILESNFENLEGKQFCKYFNNNIADILTSKKKRCEEIEITLADGITKWIKISSNPSPTGGNVGTLMDITKKKTYIPELIKLKEELKKEKFQN